MDDDPAIREAVVSVLEPHGHPVYAAADAFEGLWVMQQRPIDLLITDIEMPVCSGLELAGRVRELWPRMPILLVTGGFGDVDCAPPTPEEPCALLCKPFSAAALVDHVESLIACSGTRMQPAMAVG